jgi:integrase
VLLKSGYFQFWLGTHLNWLKSRLFGWANLPIWSFGHVSSHLSPELGVNTQMLRHWYATDMIKRGVNPEVVRKQTRHKNVSTTLEIYTQVRSEEIEASLSIVPRVQPNRPIDPTSNVIQLKWHTWGLICQF